MYSFHNHSGLTENNIADDQKRPRHIEKRTKRNKTILIIILAILILFLSILSFFAYRIIFDPVSAFKKTVAQEVNSNQEKSATNNYPALKKAVNRVNILIMGMDIDEERAETDREDFRSDTILLASVDFTDKKVDLITVPRDSYAYVKNATGKFYKINSAVYFGGGIVDKGFMNACETISILFGGIPVDYYVGLEMPGLEKLVDAIGGVYYNVDVPVIYKGENIKQGYQKLNGEQVLTYCRVRKNIGTDVDRQERQFKMIMAILKQLKNKGQLTNLPEIYRSVEDMTYTNLSFEQVCALAVLLTNLDLDNNIKHYVLEGEYHTAYGHSLYLIDQSKKVKLVEKIFGIDIPIDTEHDLYYVLQDSGGK